MKQVISCEFNIDTGCVEAQYSDGSMIAINCTAVERQVAEDRFQRAKLDWLVYNDPVAYVNLILHDDPEEYLREVTDYRPMDF